MPMTSTPTPRSITTAQAQTLGTIAVNPGRVLNPDQIAKLARLTRADVVSAARRLEARGLLVAVAPFRWQASADGAAVWQIVAADRRAANAALDAEFAAKFGPLVEELSLLLGGAR